MLRLTGLPAPSRYPRATVRLRGERLEILFDGGSEPPTQIDVDVRLLGDVEDPEATQLGLLAGLQAEGYEATWALAES
jgi:hypothetical protein